MHVPDTEIHHVVIARNDSVVAEMHTKPFESHHEHVLYSCSKTFVSIAIGIAIDENKLRLSDRVATFFPELLPDTISQNLASMTIRDLLLMATGVEPDWEYRKHVNHWVEPFLNKKVDKPGEIFKYDSMAIFLASAVLQRAVGMKTIDFLKEKLFTPMNIAIFDWEESIDGINTGGWGLRLQTEALAKIGILYLNKGNWNGKQLISEQWINESSKKQIETMAAKYRTIPSEHNQGYGYQIWRSSYPNTFRADGAHGQFIIVAPDHNLTIAITGLTHAPIQQELGAIWPMLMPRLKDEPIKYSRKEHLKLLKFCNKAKLPFLEGKSSSKLEKEVFGKTYFVETN